MDSYATTPQLMNMQSQMRFFNDLALQCGQKCVSEYESKSLSLPERTCVETCFKAKQKWNDSFIKATSQ